MNEMKKRMTRRDFLKRATILGVGATVAACAPKEEAAVMEEAVEEVKATEAPAAAAPEATAVPEMEAVEQVLNWGEAGAYNSWNAWTMSGTNDTIHNMLFNKPIWIDRNGEVHPDLADTWEMADDGKSKCKKTSISKEELDCNMKAAKGCPVNVIHILDENGKKLI